jgi:hypothetical protein
VTPFKKNAADRAMSRNWRHRRRGANLELGACGCGDGAPSLTGGSQRGTTGVFPRGRQLLAAHRYSLTVLKGSSTAAAIPLGERHDALHGSASVLPSAWLLHDRKSVRVKEHTYV